MLDLGADDLKNTHCTGTILKLSTHDGFMLHASLDCTERKISRNGSNYFLSSDINAKAAQEKAQNIKRDLKEKLKPLETKHTQIKEMKKLVETASKEEMNLDDLKNKLQALYPELYSSCWLDMAESPEEILRVL